MKKNCILFALILFITASTFAQKVKFRKIPDEALQETIHKIDSEAEAAVLHEYSRVYYAYNLGEFKLITYVHKRVKIYNQKGMDWGNFSIPYHNEGRFTKFRAYTYNLVNEKIVETKLENDGYFTEEFNKVLNRRKFAMPNLAPGAVIDIEYELSEPSTISLRPFYLQQDIPVDYIEYEVEIPEYYTFNSSLKGLPLSVKRKNTTKTGSLAEMGSSSQAKNTTYTIKVDVYQASDVPALKEEPFVPSMDNYRTSVNYELSFFRGSSGRTISFSSTWDAIADRYRASDNFGKQIDQRLNELNPVVEKAKSLPSEERMNYLFYFVRNKYKWNGNNGEFCEKGLKKLLDEKSGNVADINLLLLNLLKKADIEALPVVMSTRSNGFLNISHPSYTQINYVLAAVKATEGFIFLDATTSYLDAGFLPDRAINLDGIIITEDRKGVRVSIENPNKGSVQNTVLSELKEDLTITGKIRTIYSNYDAGIARAAFKTAEKEGGYVKKLHERYPAMDIINYSESGADSLQPRMIENIEFVLEGQVDQVGDHLYLNPMMIWQDKTNDLKSEKREFPVFYLNTGMEKHMISIKIPDGYEVESFPKATRLSLPEGLGSFIYSVTVVGNNISILYQYDKVADIISPTFYAALRNFQTLVIDKQAEKIVLKKI
ncbi:MAG: DUF3857 domain-containing protein [Bacteroidales bacterium]|nr:DUF3857 domain-containing protein [Bacteroidales bacterium]